MNTEEVEKKILVPLSPSLFSEAPVYIQCIGQFLVQQILRVNCGSLEYNVYESGSG